MQDTCAPAFYIRFLVTRKTQLVTGSKSFVSAIGMDVKSFYTLKYRLNGILSVQ